MKLLLIGLVLTTIFTGCDKCGTSKDKANYRICSDESCRYTTNIVQVSDSCIQLDDGTRFCGTYRIYPLKD